MLKLILLFFISGLPILTIAQQTNDKNESLSFDPDSSVYTIVEEMPEFGLNKGDLQEFITKESKFKTSKTRTPNSKNIFVQIIIEKDGSVTFDKIIQGDEKKKKYNKEAQRIAENMPDWSVGRTGDFTPARVIIMFPVWFIK